MMYKRGKMRESLIGLVLIILLVAPLFLRIGQTVALEQRTEKIEVTEDLKRETAPDEDSAIDQPSKIDYILPYPGILPNHPLYPIKVLRDRILEFLIRDPLRKIDFYLLMADKRLNMGIFLRDKDKPELAETTISKGEKYFLKGIDQLEYVDGSDSILLPDGTVAKYQTASLKHQEVIEELGENAPENLKAGYNSSLGLVQEAQQRIQALGK